MRIAGKNIQSGANKEALLFIAGLILGFLTMNIGKGTWLINTGLFDEDTLYQMKYMTVDSGALFCYILRKRMCGVLVLSVAATTYLGMAVCMGAVFWYGISAGVFFSALLLRYGIKGIVLAVVSIFPQYLLYVPAFLLFLKWAEQLYKSIYSRSAGCDVSDKGFALKKMGELALVVGLIAIGCLLEGYLNPRLLLGYLKVF